MFQCVFLLPQECVECCLHSLTELLLHYKLGNERWLDALTDTFTHLDKSGHMTITLHSHVCHVTIPGV